MVNFLMYLFVYKHIQDCEVSRSSWTIILPFHHSHLELW